RDHRALAHPAAQPKWILVDQAFWPGNADPLQHFDAALARFLFSRIGMQPDHLRNLIANGVHQTERGHRLLKDHRNLIPPNLADEFSFWIEFRQVDDLICLTVPLAMP